MATNLTLKINKGDPDVAVGETGADYIEVDLTHDYFIWTAGSDVVKAGQDEPTPDELNQASTLITDADVKVAHCLLFDYSTGGGVLEEVEGMGLNHRYVFAFSFDGATATEPQLEAWDDTDHDSYDKNVLGLGGITGEESFVKAICTTGGDPGADWETSIDCVELAGSTVLLLNDGNGAVDAPATGETAELYANIEIIIPADYATPAVEDFITSIRYTWM